ncbi:MAG: hypothetical protein LBJ96_05645 [Holosporaceae bacterium]|jgi:hypothetical protein|nr:hypothetical protein [Holosporaceae bacterium]
MCIKCDRLKQGVTLVKKILKQFSKTKIIVVIFLLSILGGYLYFHTRLDKISDSPTGYSAFNLKEERELFLKIVGQSKKYLEFGSGGSTFEVLKHSQADVTSVEGSKSWYEHMKSWSLIKNSKRLKLLYVDLGETADWSVPVEKSKQKLWPGYSAVPFNLSDPQLYDTILIDGRFRVACGIMSIICCPNAVIMIHDFPDRPKYHILLNFMEITDQAGTLCVFKVKKTIDIKRLQRLYEHYKYIYD